MSLYTFHTYVFELLLQSESIVGFKVFKREQRKQHALYHYLHERGMYQCPYYHDDADLVCLYVYT